MTDDFDITKKKVLFIEPIAEIGRQAGEMFASEGLTRYHYAQSAEQALKVLTRATPDVIFVAMHLPGLLNGIQFIQQVRGMLDVKKNSIPILVLVNKPRSHLLKEACRAGVEGVLRKPFEKDKLLRFTKAVIQHPKRFILIRHYFGPERRVAENPDFKGEDRRKPPLESEIFSAKPKDREWAFEVIKVDPVEKKAEEVLKVDPPMGKAPAEPIVERVEEKKPVEHKEKLPTVEVTTHLKEKKVEDRKPLPAKPKPKPKLAAKPKAIPPKQKPPEEDAMDTALGVQAPMARQKGTSNGAPPRKVNGEAVLRKPSQITPALGKLLDAHRSWVSSSGAKGSPAEGRNIDMSRADLTGNDLTGARLPFSNLKGADCTAAVFRKADLSGSIFSNAKLEGADFAVSRLAGADFRKANLAGANFLGADLSRADLRGATLTGSDLTGANLMGTNLCGADLSTAKGLNTEQVAHARTDQHTKVNAIRPPQGYLTGR